ncbi:hypothetical protein H4R34_002573 [Dimargaris verticillata]|uniref:DASH complex subunit SPC19 n=1 Tax=Dimargaris verticillata TaxID=2761393 RepID=A0A9W8ECS7_9FUNG|nr:hypothetical protein H4R34_002573 [Dimargaris verticillata]
MANQRALGQCVNALQSCQGALADTLSSLHTLTSSFDRTTTLLRQNKTAEYVPEAELTRLQSVFHEQMIPTLQTQVEWLESAMEGVQAQHTELEEKVQEKLEQSVDAEAQERVTQRYHAQIEAAHQRLTEEEDALVALANEIALKQRALMLDTDPNDLVQSSQQTEDPTQQAVDSLKKQLKALDTEIDNAQCQSEPPTAEHDGLVEPYSTSVTATLDALTVHVPELKNQMETQLWPYMQEIQRQGLERLTGLFKVCFPTLEPFMTDILHTLLATEGKELVVKTLAERYTKPHDQRQLLTQAITTLCSLGLAETAVEVNPGTPTNGELLLRIRLETDQD